MVKQTQKVMIVAAGLLVLLLAFGLGFYTYPLLAPIDVTPLDGAQLNVAASDGAQSAVDGGNAASTGSAEGDSDSGDGTSDESTVSDATQNLEQDSGPQNDEPISEASSTEAEAPKMSVDELDISGVEPEDLAIFLDAWRALDHDFFGDKPPSRQQIYGSIRGLLQAYDDPYTFFIEPETNEVEQGNLRGSFGGIGAHVQPTEFGYILDPMRDNPAWEAGVEKGDILVGVDKNEITADTSMDEVVSLIRGPMDTEVALDLLRPVDINEISSESLIDAEAVAISITRGEIKTPSMDWRIITGDEVPVDFLLERFDDNESESEDAGSNDVEQADVEQADVEQADSGEASSEEAGSEEARSAQTNSVDSESELPIGISEDDVASWKRTKIGYIQHRIYSDRSPEEMRTAVEELLADGADRFIIDLRGNPGGPVTSVVHVTDLWVDDPLIMVEERADGGKQEFESSIDTIVTDEPVVIVVDGGSASASEIFAGALRDHERAVIVGETTFGKGSVQVIHVLPDSSSMHITNALWFTPDGHRIDGEGLIPDIVIEPGADSLNEAILEILDIDIE